MKNLKKWVFLNTVILLAVFPALFWNPSLSASTNTIVLTQAERNFITAHPVIHLGVDPSFIPYEFIDTDGVYKGIAPDYIALISQRIGIQFIVEKSLTWAQAYEKAVRKELDVLPCIAKTREREPYFLFSASYYSFLRVVFINTNNKDIASFNDLMNKKVAVQTNSSHYGFLQEYPSIQMSLYSDVVKALQAVSSGTETAFVGNLATSNYLIKDNGITNLKYIEIASEEKQLLYFAVRNDWPELVSILNKGLASITQEEKLTINNRWVGVEKNFDYTLLFQIIGIAGLVIVLIIVVSSFWIVRLRKEIAKRKIIQEELRIAKDEAEHANQIKSTFLARMSHEIRTPLNAITGIAYLIKKTDVTVTQQQYLDKITQAARSMLNIINDILDFSRIEAGKIDLERVSFNIDKVIDHVINIVFLKIEEKGIEFSMNKDPDIPTFFWGDPTRIEQILVNIVSNAIKFTDKGSVAFSIQLEAKDNNAHVIQFRIKDTGIGMSKEQILHLFQPFSQADASISRRFGGTGLGLSIVNSLVNMMNGKIQVYSTEGEGSTFIVQLTLEADLRDEHEENKKSIGEYFKNIRILVIEKNITNLNLVKEYLHSFGLNAEFSSSEEGAFEMIRNASRENHKPYGLLLLDSETPQGGGIEFYAKVKSQLSYKETPKCILMIPLTKGELFDQLEASGIDFGITKPILPSILYNGIVEVFKINLMGLHRPSPPDVKKESALVQYPYHVLVVEDNKTNQFIAQSILEQSGFKVSLADNGQEGVDFFLNNQNNIDLILMDLHMPVMNGLEATVLIRKTDGDIPIIAMTADAISGVEQRCKEAGIDYYISKPFEPEQFVETIVKVINPEKRKRLEETMPVPAVDDIGNILDEEDGLRRIGGDAALYQAVLHQYYQENKDVPAVMAGKINEQQYEDAIKIAHKIKSSSGSIGAKSLQEAASGLQQALISKEEPQILRFHQEFQLRLEKLLHEIELRQPPEK